MKTVKRTVKSFIDQNTTYVSIALVIIMLGGVWKASAIAANVQQNTDKLETVPTKTEFETLQDDIEEIKESLKELNQYILNQKTITP